MIRYPLALAFAAWFDGATGTTANLVAGLRGLWMVAALLPTKDLP